MTERTDSEILITQNVIFRILKRPKFLGWTNSEDNGFPKLQICN